MNPETATMDAMFESFKELIEKDHNLKEEIAKVAHEAEFWVLRIFAILQKMHTFRNGQDEQLKKVWSMLDGEVKEYLKRLVDLISPHSYYRYHDSFRFIIQKLCFVVTYAHFLEHGNLLNRDKVAEILNLKVDPSEGFHLDVEDYLFGTLHLAEELSRLSINAVVAGNSVLPFKIADFLYDLDAKFRLLNLKNDSLRRKYDALKYDVQRAGQVVYDLTIRGLKPPQRQQEESSME